MIRAMIQAERMSPVTVRILRCSKLKYQTKSSWHFHQHCHSLLLADKQNSVSYLGGVLQREVDGVEAVEADCDEAVDGGGAEDDIRCDVQLAGPQA